jgi:hypothetical protein
MKRLAFAFLLVAGCSRSSEAQTPSAPPPPAPAQKAPGSHAEGQGFIVDVKLPPSAQVGAAATAKVVLRPTGGYHVNKEFPTNLTVTPPANVDVPKVKQTGADAAKLAEDEAVFEVPFTAKDAGDKRFEATFKFAVCTPETCDPKSEKLAWTVAVK